MSKEMPRKDIDWFIRNDGNGAWSVNEQATVAEGFESKETAFEYMLEHSPAPHHRRLWEERQAEKVTINMRVDAALLARIDAAAKRQGVSRTAWVWIAVAEKLER